MSLLQIQAETSGTLFVAKFFFKLLFQENVLVLCKFNRHCRDQHTRYVSTVQLTCWVVGTLKVSTIEWNVIKSALTYGLQISPVKNFI